ncbi:8-oxoguanine deaminase [Enhygromyxa salina]|uniref:8-oxoguanine deaminase n=1 Tax=Enhygromyxa salina TaxID=215803 RepID=A0A2S9XJF4_9BACT|nr:formimidoylglutamate deiminase [Enhygromyxa salina]PRP92870.1 8-oxoguanine deaminase [Enhygromyxa salina]
MSASEVVGVTARLAWVELDGRPQLVREPEIRFDRATGTILSIRPNASRPNASLEDAPAPGQGLTPLHDLGPALLLPGMVNAHSHAFQRAIRGATHRRAATDPSSFWTWRAAMYEAANALDPDAVYAQTRACFAEMLGRGITCVGEFHYLHHGPDGRPYADPNELSRQVIRAAEDVGLRLSLLEVYYARSGPGSDGPQPEQRRFCDGSTDAYLARVDALRELAASVAWLELGVAPHSVRAVRADELARLAAYANEHRLPIHAHVSEQPVENQQCRDEHGRAPLELFADAGCLARERAFTAVHAIHVEAPELELLRAQQVCACPTTEADLGDGVVPAARWREHGATLALGSDSNAVIDLVQEARLLEMHARLRDQARLRLRDDAGQVAPVLLAAATTGGAQALARPELGRLAVGSPFDALALDLGHPMLDGVAEDRVVDALFLAGTAEPISQVWVGGKRRI